MPGRYTKVVGYTCQVAIRTLAADEARTAGARVRLPWSWNLAFWWVIAAIAATTKLAWWHLMSPADEADFSVLGRAAYQLVVYTTWALLTPVVFRVSALIAGSRRWSRRLSVAVAAAVSVALAMGLLRSLAHNLEHADPYLHGLDWIARDFLGRVHEDLMIFVAVLAVGLATRYHGQREAQRAAAASLRAELAAARLHALQAQLEPHFLFNALNSVSALVERDPQATRRVVARLSELLRRSLDAAGEQEVTLREELAFIDGYLDIMKVRFGDRLDAHIDAGEGVLDALVPAFVLQPLVENAFKHGVSRVRGPAEVEVRVRRQEDRLRLTVRDSGPGVRAAEGGGGVGLSNLRARLRELYPQGHRLTLCPIGEAGTEVEVELPYRMSPMRSAA